MSIRGLLYRGAIYEYMGVIIQGGYLKARLKGGIIAIYIAA